MSDLLKLNNVWKSFYSIIALKNINLTIEQGKIVTLLGPSGSGKTTLLRILGGLDNITKGTFFYENIKITSQTQNLLRQKATLVFQRSVFFNTTVYNNIAFGLKLKNDLSQDEIKTRINESLDLVRLEGFENRKAKKLSGGEQQRVSLARALVLNRELLLLDEPTVNLDPKNVSIIEETIQRVNKEKKTTIVIATHNMFQAETISQTVVLLFDGTVKQNGTKLEIFGKSNKYLSSFARLENVFSGKSEIDKGISKIIVDDKINIEAAFKKQGNITFYVNPEDILVSKERIKSSARNVFEGKVIGITDLGSITKLLIDGGKKITVQITKKSLLEMNLNVGSKVYLTFKASSVHLI